MITLSLVDVKQKMLDVQKVMASAEAASIRALTKFGAYVRRRAQTSMRRRTSISEPGTPPSAHTGLIRDNVLFVVEPATKNVIIGPMLLNKSSLTALSSLEHGGESLIMKHGKPSMVLIQPRPFMQPAFEKELEKAAYLWENGLR